MENGPQGPLAGIKVVECTTWAFGPMAGAMLGDLGADVIKVENPTTPDQARTLLYVAGVDCSLPDGTSSLFEIMNRNKRSIAIDLKSEQGKEVLRALAKDADVFLENFRPGVFDRLGIGYESLAKLNPRLIYASTSGYGFEGAEAQRPALDPVGQARSGLMWSTGRPGDPPNWISMGWADIMGATMLSYGIICALAARELHGIGQKIECSHLMASMWLEYFAIGVCMFKGLKNWERFDRLNAANPLFNHYRCADDEWLMLGIVDATRHWGTFCEAMDLLDLAEDPRFATLEKRAENRQALIAILDARYAEKPRREWEARLNAHPDLVFDRVQRIGDLRRDPQVQANDFLVEVAHPRHGNIRYLNHPVEFSQTPASIRRTAPLLGEHTWEILQERLGYSEEQIVALATAGVIG